MTENAENLDPANPNKIQMKELTTGMLVAQVALLVMAVIPIYFGTKAAIHTLRSNKEKEARGEKVDGGDVEIIGTKDAMKFPLTASCALFGLYVIVKKVDPTYLNYLLCGYF